MRHSFSLFRHSFPLFLFLSLLDSSAKGLPMRQVSTPTAINSPTPTIPDAPGSVFTVTVQATVDQSGRVREARATGTRVELCRAGAMPSLQTVLEAWRKDAVAAMLKWQFEPPSSAPVIIWVQFKNGSFDQEPLAIAILNRAGRGDSRSRVFSQEPPHLVSVPCAPEQQFFVANLHSGYSLRADGVGPYTHDSQGVRAFAQYAISFCTDPRSCTTLPEGQPVTPSLRAVQLDLTGPIAASGAKSLGLISAGAANFGAFWGQDTTQRVPYNGVEGPLIRSVLDMTVGSTVESERVEIRFFLNDAQHILQFGPWVAGQYQTTQTGLHGDGTTRGTITRVSERTWRIKSGTDSIGRLWNNRDPLRPVDLGLYRFSYDVQFDRQ